MPRSLKMKLRRRTSWLFMMSALTLAAVSLVASRHWAPSGREVTTESDRAHALYLAGVDALHKYWAEDAISFWKEATREDPGFAAAWTRLSATALTLGRPQEARDYWQRANALRTRVSRREALEIDRVDALLRKDPSAAKAVDERIAREFPRDAEVRLRLADQLLETDSRAAATACRDLLRDNPTLGAAYNLLGYALLDLQDLEGALEAFQKYTFMYPDQPNPHDSLGELYLTLGQYDAAREEFERAIQLKPDFSWAIMHLAMIALDLGQPEVALHTADRGSQMYPDGLTQAFWHQLRFQALLARGDIQGAQALTLQRVEDAPDDPMAWLALADIAAHAKAPDDLQRAAQHCRALMDPHPGTARTTATPDSTYLGMRLRGVMAEADADWTEASAAFAAAADRTGNWYLQCISRLESADAALASGDPTRALIRLDRILQVNPGHPAALYYRGRALEALERFTEAQTAFESSAQGYAHAEPGHLLARAAKLRAAAFSTGAR